MFCDDIDPVILQLLTLSIKEPAPDYPPAAKPPKKYCRRHCRGQSSMTNATKSSILRAQAEVLSHNGRSNKWTRMELSLTFSLSLGAFEFTIWDKAYLRRQSAKRVTETEAKRDYYRGHGKPRTELAICEGGSLKINQNPR
jgi:hypothetical protein